MAERESRVRPRVIPGLLKVCLAMLLFCGLAAGQETARGNAPDGAAIFSQRCSKCHGDRGQGIAAAVTIAGPSLQAEHDLGNVMTAVESGPSHMPAFSRVLTAGQIQAVSHYVTTNLAVIPLTQGEHCCRRPAFPSLLFSMSPDGGARRRAGLHAEGTRLRSRTNPRR